ncbi:Putative serine/threonine-protein kinase, active [Septoria linicola]|uniref:mitogen-activated protein kinase kinase n=1 Tax=Septoria linicola TaxID=215465 RepID=A0A9Q9AMN8_9PEZI|nr:putative serine/threonine-protein kinase, active [Septoria linicola]USW49748.1 Putative serine/threonine-protein kinase, active [Septoria linicola]
MSEQSQSPLDSPSPPTSPDELNSPFGSPEQERVVSPPVQRMQSDSGVPPSVAGMTASSTARGQLDAARRPAGATFARGNPPTMNADIAAKMRAFSLARSGPAIPQPNRTPSTSGQPAPGGFPSNFRLPPGMNRPTPVPTNSSPAVTGGSKPMSLAEKRGLRLPGGLPGAAPTTPAAGAPAGRRKPPGMTLSSMGGAGANGDAAGQEPKKQETAMDKYADLIDTKTGALNFKGKATVHGGGIDFTSGKSFSISLDEVDTLDELGKGNYGTVYKVRHARPKFRKTGQGLAGNKARGPLVDEEQTPPSPTRSSNANTTPTNATAQQAYGRGGTTGIVMAMKEMRLELDDAKFQSIIMELDILHRCVSPYIVDFYGAFFQEGAVYICMEFMDGGSCDKIYGDGVPEGVLRKITYNTTLGLKSLKEEHNIIHRDVKPTNILMNTRGQVKICDFGVSGNLVASIAKTNIGCQSYMAPERISSGGGGAPGGAIGTYSVQSDIWSLGLTIIECALGRYPYPPETYDNIFSQLAAIVDGDPPDLPTETFSEAARDFVAGCLNKIPKLRPTYPMLLQHAWLAPLDKPATITEEDEDAEAAAEAAAAAGEDIPEPASEASSLPLEDQGEFVDREVGEWVIEALRRKKAGILGQSTRPPLDVAPLNATAGQ